MSAQHLLLGAVVVMIASWTWAWIALAQAFR